MNTDPTPEGSLVEKPSVPPPPRPNPPLGQSVNSALQRPMPNLMAPRTNGTIDYIVAFLLFVAPWVLSYDDHAVAPVSRTLGAMLLGYSLCTKYDLGLLRFIPLQVHLFLDLGMAGLLFAAPVHFGIWGTPGILMVFLGALMGFAALLTRHGQKFTRPSTDIRRTAERPISRQAGTGSTAP